jgi:hypothetical protein
VRIVATKLVEGVQCPPTDLGRIGTRLNIVGFYPEDLAVSGELRHEGGTFKVVYSSKLSAERRRFTIAHEIAHAVFESTGRGCPRRGRELERLCDMMAAEILMPREVFLKLVGPRISVAGVLELGRVFKTSLSATAIRCAELMGVSAFEVQDGDVTWGYGEVRRGRVSGLPGDLRRAVEDALSGKAEEQVVFFRGKTFTGEWSLDSGTIGAGKRGLFLLEPSVRRRSG